MSVLIFFSNIGYTGDSIRVFIASRHIVLFNFKSYASRQEAE
jgi:hypothetical protein